MVPLISLLLCGMAASLPFPSAIYPPNPIGSHHGNMTSPQALAEIAMFEARLLNDPVSYTVGDAVKPWPWKRKILYVSNYTTANDGKDDWWGLYYAMYDAHLLSLKYWEEYKAAIAKDPTLPRLAGAGQNDVRHVLVELRFERNAVYDIGEGLDGMPNPGNWLLTNGQNCTIMWHPEANYSHHTPNDTRGWRGNTWQFVPTYAYWQPLQVNPRYILNINFIMSKPPTTLARVIGIVQDSHNQVIAIDLKAEPLHVAFSEINEVSYQHTDDQGKLSMTNHPIGSWNGIVTSSEPEKVEGVMRLTFKPENYNYPAPYARVGQYFGLSRYSMITPGIHNVFQGINLAGASGWGFGKINMGDYDMIDVHLDRLPHLKYVVGGGPAGQLTGPGTYRFFHVSMEAGADDNININAGNYDVIEVNTTDNSLKFRQVNGAWENEATFRQITCYEDGTRLGFAREATVLNVYKNITTNKCEMHFESTPLYSRVWLNESVADIQVGDVIWDLDANPTLMHIKNYRSGNHELNDLNIKGLTVLVEDSFMFNSTLGSVDISTDSGFWREGNPVRNLTVRNNVFEGSYAAVIHTPYDKNGIPPTGTETISITNNWFFVNASDARGTGWNPYVPILLYAAKNVTVENNSFFLVPGMNTDSPLIDLCNANNVVIRGNLINNRTLIGGQWGGNRCLHNGTDCPMYNISRTVQVRDTHTWPQWTSVPTYTCKNNLTNVAVTCNTFNNINGCIPKGAVMRPQDYVKGGNDLNPNSSSMAIAMAFLTLAALLMV